MYTPLGKFLQISQGALLNAGLLRGGRITSQELIIAGGTNGVIRSQNFDPTNELGWAVFGDGSASFYGDVFFGENAIFQGDLYSANWDGTIPINLSSIDTGATQGFAMDSSEGNVQIQSLFAAGIALLDVSNNNTQVGAIGGSNDELLINSMTAKNLRLQTLTGGEIQLDPGTGGKTVLNSDTEINGTLTFIDEDETADVDTLPIIHAVKNNVVDWSFWIEGPNDNAIGAANPPRIELWGAQGSSNGITFYAEGSATFFANVGIPDGLVGGFPGLYFSNDFDNGMVRTGSNAWSLLAGGTQVIQMESTAVVFGGQARFPASTGWSFSNDTDLGVYRQGTNNARFVAGGTDVAGWSGSGLYTISSTTGSAANVHLAAAGLSFLVRSTSARKYKSNITDAPDLADLILQPVRFWRDDDQAWYYGFIADDLVEQDPLLGTYENGEVENYDQRAVMAVMAAKINRLERLLNVA